jgi:hypothetical protein
MGRLRPHSSCSSVAAHQCAHASLHGTQHAILRSTPQHDT